MNILPTELPDVLLLEPNTEFFRYFKDAGGSQ